eukprot:2157584-Rhodomonas_salina.1
MDGSVSTSLVGRRVMARVVACWRRSRWALRGVHRTALTALALHAVCRTRDGARGHERRCVLEHARSVSGRAYYDACGCGCSICRRGLPRSARAPFSQHRAKMRRGGEDVSREGKEGRGGEDGLREGARREGGREGEGGDREWEYQTRASPDRDGSKAVYNAILILHGHMQSSNFARSRTGP